jgi:GH25 family lysozyme M1 (1,4-beta-N-acetylmuramidase)
MIQGYDFSQYQGVIPQSVFDTLKSQGWFCIIRVNEGTPNNPQVLNIDSQFTSNQQKARSIGMLRGYYHFSYPTLNTALSEADFFVQTIGQLQDGEILALDFETPIGGSSPTQANVTWAKTWLDEVASKTNGTKPLIYMDLNLCNTLDWTLVSDAGYGLWLADWTGDPNQLGKANNWSFIAMSQFSDQALVAGIGDRVDQDAFYGDATQFQAYGYHATIPVVPVTPSSPTQSGDTDTTEIASLTGQIESLTSQVSALNATLAGYKTDLTDAQTQISTLKQQNQNLNNSNTSLAQRNGELVMQVSALNKQPKIVDVAAPVVNTSLWSKVVAFFKSL